MAEPTRKKPKDVTQYDLRGIRRAIVELVKKLADQDERIAKLERPNRFHPRVH
jgi:hypothetical protein